MEVSKKISMKRVKTDDPNSVDIFINALKNNQIIAYPTDTIYGLGTDINNNEGIDRINSIKIRKQPMSVALGNFEIIKSNIRAKEEMLKKIEETLNLTKKLTSGYLNANFFVFNPMKLPNKKDQKNAIESLSSLSFNEQYELEIPRSPFYFTLEDQIEATLKCLPSIVTFHFSMSN